MVGAGADPGSVQGVAGGGAAVLHLHIQKVLFFCLFVQLLLFSFIVYMFLGKPQFFFFFFCGTATTGRGGNLRALPPRKKIKLDAGPLKKELLAASLI